jgi:hypothetical protein
MSLLLIWIAGHLSRCDRYVGLVGLDTDDRNQWQTQVARFLEQAMECCLVGDRATDDGGAIALMGQAKSVKPDRPPRIEVSFKTDFVPSRVAMTSARCLAHDRNVGGDVVSGHHHMW